MDIDDDDDDREEDHADESKLADEESFSEDEENKVESAAVSESSVLQQDQEPATALDTHDDNELEVNDTSKEDHNHDEGSSSVSNEEEEGEGEGEEGNKSEESVEDIENIEDEEDEVVNPRKRRRAPVVSSHKIRKIKLKTYYYQNCYYTTPTSVILMNLVCSRSGVGVPIDTLWQGAIGAYDQYERNNITYEIYDLLCDRIKLLLGNHMDMTSANSSSYTVNENINVAHTVSPQSVVSTTSVDSSSQNSIVVTNAETGNVVEGTEYRFFLLNHWSIYQSMLHSPYVLIKLMTWKPSGQLKLQELLALLGMSLNQAKKSFSLLPPQLKNNVLHDLVNKETIKRNYGLFDPDVTIRCFCRYTMFRMSVSTKDMVIAASSFLNICNMNSSVDTNADGSPNTSGDGGNNNQKLAFNQAYDCLSTKSDDLLKKGINLAILIQTAIVKKVAGLLENYDAITRVQRMHFTYIYKVGHSSDININMNIVSADTSSGTTGSANILPSDCDIQTILSNPRVLLQIGNLLMNIKMNITKRDGGWTGSKLLPLFLLCEKKDTTIIIGISPLGFLQSSSSSLVNVGAKQMELIKKISNFYLFYSLAAREMKIPIKLKFGKLYHLPAFVLYINSMYVALIIHLLSVMSIVRHLT